ncbi:NAD-dependent succinate-semialdehyde dehydrogenase [Desulfovibrio sp. X2]|uniref:NAD-dependent succinate-semialdehyde dehydrogenase n=1 Tax=Desulfovibrio sp. X2 TaxID=941449 RepID=UPI000553FBF0|nr:NAD-dependent succinate-semialdehyde dehydrogenase [Desulfovibrio sp. X2]
MAMISVNPATGEELERFREMTPEEVRAVVERTRVAQLAWRETALEERARLLHRAAEVLRDDVENLARTMTLEMGKPIVQARAEVEKCASVCDFYADNGAAYLAPEAAVSDAARSYAAFRPLGTVFLVMPWNYPYWQVFRQGAPNLMAGNGLLLKHASNVPGCALSIEKVLREAGFPEDIFRTLMIGSSQVNAVLEEPSVRAVSLTGSDAAGRAVAAKAGSLLKKSVLELGGSDPFVVLADADIERAAAVGAMARCGNTGQACIAAKRFIVVGKVYDEFLARLKEHMAALKVGDPLDESNQLGPMARENLRRELHAQVEASVAAGAKLALGGAPLPGPGAYYPPTILTDVKPGMPAWREEFFGPVAIVIRVANDEEAVAVANDTPFGLGGSVWTRDEAKGEALAARIEAGCVFVNGMVKSDPRLPFGGVKESGYGRELSHYGMRELVNIQTVWIA